MVYIVSIHHECASIHVVSVSLSWKNRVHASKGFVGKAIQHYNERIRISYKCVNWLAAQIVRSPVCTYVL